MSTTPLSLAAVSSTASSPIVDSKFPPSVAGEEYERYRRSVWRQGERWFFRNTHRIARESIDFRPTVE